MSERTANRGVAAAGAIIVALGVAGLWFLLDDAPEEHGPEKVALSRTVPAASRPTKAAPSRQAPPSAARPEKRPEGVLEVEVFSENKPLPGAQVQVYEREPVDLSVFPARWFGKDTGPTGADGRWVLPIAPGSYYVTARAEGFGPGYATVVHAPGSAKTRVRLSLDKGEELVGSTLVKGTGEPVSLAEILLTPPALPSGARDRLDAPEEETLVATSNEAGEFRFSGLSPGRYRIEARAPGYASVVLPSAPIPFRGRATLLMVPSGHLDGTVLGADGQPVDGAEVLAMGRQQASSALSDSEGHFSLELPPGAYAVSARKGPEVGALEEEVKVAMGQPIQGLRLQLGAGAWVSGKVVRGDGSPILGARVEAWPQRRSAASGETGTDETGAFSLPALAAGTYVLHVFMPEGLQFTHGPVTLASGEHISLTLTYDEARALDGSLTCMVRGGALGRGVKGAWVQATSLGSQATAAPRTMEGLTNSWGLVVLAGLAPGVYRVEARRDAHAPGVEQSVLVERMGNRPSCTLSLPDPADSDSSMATLEGRVLQRSGVPPSEPVVIEVFHQGPPGSLRKQIPVDDQGRFRTTVPPGSYTLTASWQRSPGCATAGTLQVQAQAGLNPETRMLLEEHAADLRLRVLDVDGAPAKLAQTRGLDASLHFAEFVQTDEQGRLDLCLPSQGVQQPAAPARLVIDSFDHARAAMVEVTRGRGDVTVQLRPLPAVQGRILPRNGVPVRHLIVDILFPSSYEPPRTYEFVGEHFELPRFPLGPSQLLVNADGMRASLFLDLQPEERKVLEIPVYPDVSLKGRLVDATTRQPLARWLVIPQPFPGDWTEPDGRFSLRGLPVGELLLRISRLPTPLHVKLAPEQDNDLGDIPVSAQ